MFQSGDADAPTAFDGGGVQIYQEQIWLRIGRINDLKMVRQYVCPSFSRPSNRVDLYLVRDRFGSITLGLPRFVFEQSIAKVP